jgi:hypothetical protein
MHSRCSTQTQPYRPDMAKRSAAQVRGIQVAVLLALTWGSWGSALADVYRCVAPDGKTLYGDAPCPREAVRKSNITTTVGACTTAECAAKREQLTGQARERLRTEQEQLAEFADRRQRNEIAADKERARLEALAWRQSMEATPAAMGSEPANTIAYAPYYSFYPVYPVHSIVKPCGWRCFGLHPRAANTAPVRRTWGTAIRLDHR